MSFSQLIKNIRKELKLTQKELCKFINMKQTKYSAIEKGKIAATKQEMVNIFSALYEKGMK